MSGSIEDRVSICVATVRRPYCIQRFINSVRANYPRIPIIVGDQEKPNLYLHRFYESKGAVVVYVAEDAGVAVARNRAVAEANTEYILLCDDDFVFSNETRFEAAVGILDEDKTIDILGGFVKDIDGHIDTAFATARRWEQFFTIDRKRRIIMTTMIDSFSPRRREVNGVPYFLADVVLNWKIFRRSIFSRGAGWDPRFKCNGEHSDFYFNVKENTDLGVAYCPAMSVYHHSPADFSYMAKREQPEGFRLLAEKWGVDEVLDIGIDQPRVDVAQGWITIPQSNTADPSLLWHGAVIPIDGEAPGPLDPETWPASHCAADISVEGNCLQVLFIFGEEEIAVTDGASFSLLVAVENQSERRIGCLGGLAPKLSYRVHRTSGPRNIIERERFTPFTHDLTPGVTFHYINVAVDWDSNPEEKFELEVDIYSEPNGWLRRSATLGLIVRRPEMPEVEAVASSEQVIDFRNDTLPDFLIRAAGLSAVEKWGRWSDANLSEGVLLRFFRPLPRRFRLEMTCRTTPQNSGAPVRVEIGGTTQTFAPTKSLAVHQLEFALAEPGRNIKLHPTLAIVPSSLDPNSKDHRRLGIGLTEMRLIPAEDQEPETAAGSDGDAQSGPARREIAIIDFKRRHLPDAVIQMQGLSSVEPLGRWSDADVDSVVALRFRDPLPKTLRLELTCRAYGPNAGRPSVVEIGAARQTFTPTESFATYELDFVLDRPERTIRIHPASPTSPAELDVREHDNRRLGLMFLELTITSEEPPAPGAGRESGARPHPRASQAELAFWDRLYSQEDPWNYKADYEQKKYAHTLELLPDAAIARALEIGCAEGLFTEMLAPRVGELLAIDISERALSRAKERCERFGNTSFKCADISERLPDGPFDLIVCSEVLYYLKDRFAVQDLARRIAKALAPNGRLLMAHANCVNDDRTVTGFDFSEIGAVFIGERFAAEPAFDFVKELRTPLYRVQLFMRRATPHGGEADRLEVRKVPREVIERPATFSHPLIRWGGCAVTFAEAQFLYDTVDIPILMYHRIAIDGPPDLAPYRLSPEAFERQLAYLRRYGYSTIGVDEAAHFNCDLDSRRPGKWIALSFDDAYQDFAELAWPLLQRYGFTATVFVPIDHAGDRAVWDGGFGEPARLMDWATIRRLATEGVTFGSHGCSHRSLTSLAPEQLAEEVGRSRRVLGDALGKAPRGFCYPYTDFDASVMAAVAEAGYDYALAGDVAAEAGRRPFSLARIEIRGDDDLDRFVAKLPLPRPSSQERQQRYRRMRAVRSRDTYPTIPLDPDEEIETSLIPAPDIERRSGSTGATLEDVHRLYEELLGREPDSASAVESHAGRPLVDVAIDIALSKEFLQRARALTDLRGATREDVVTLYQLFFDRDPESEAALSAQVGCSIMDIVKSFARSSEFSEQWAQPPQIAADIGKLGEVLLPEAPVDHATALEIARIAKFHKVRSLVIAAHMSAMRKAMLAAKRGEALAGPCWPEPSFGPFRPDSLNGDKIELVVPTANSARRLEPFLQFYQSNNIRVVYAVDRRTTDGTRELIGKYGFRMIEVQGDQPRVESVLPSIAAHIAAPWILRVDDDELPTPKLLEFAAAVAGGESRSSYSFPRAEYRCNPASGRLERSYIFVFGPDGGLNMQCRLYRPDSVAYRDELHSPGFVPMDDVLAPDDAYLLHFDWVVRSRAERQAKFEAYERQSPVHARACKHCTLHEVVPESWHIFGTVRDDRLQEFTKSLLEGIGQPERLAEPVT